MGAVLMLLFTVILPGVKNCTTGMDVCDTSAFCTDTDGGFECTCGMGYSGDGFTCAGLLCINIHNLHIAPKVGNWLISPYTLSHTSLHVCSAKCYSDVVFCSPMRKLVHVSLQ